MPRFTVKNLLIATALVAICLWFACWYVRRYVEFAHRNRKAVDEINEQLAERDRKSAQFATSRSKQPAESKAVNVRRIPIPQREHGYKNFKSLAITDKEEFESFLNDVTQQEHWNRKDEFLTALRSAAIDFDNEVLLLVRSTAGSGSIKISLAEPAIVGAEIVFRVLWKMPEVATMDMNYQCFAVTVPRTAATNARIATELVPVPERSRNFKIEPQVIPLSHGSTGK